MQELRIASVEDLLSTAIPRLLAERTDRHGNDAIMYLNSALAALQRERSAPAAAPVGTLQTTVQFVSIN